MESTLTLDDYAKKARLRMIVHAERAIDVIEDQLTRAKSPSRIARLQSRVAEYKQALSTLKESNGIKEENTSDAK